MGNIENLLKTFNLINPKAKVVQLDKNALETAHKQSVIAFNDIQLKHNTTQTLTKELADKIFINF